MSTIWFLRNRQTGEIKDFIIGPHPSGSYDEAEWESIDSGESAAEGIPDWTSRAVYEKGLLREMTDEEKAAADAQREIEQKGREFNADRALHVAFKVFLEELNSLRQEVGLAALDQNQVKNRLREEYIQI